MVMGQGFFGSILTSLAMALPSPFGRRQHSGCAAALGSAILLAGTLGCSGLDPADDTCSAFGTCDGTGGGNEIGASGAGNSVDPDGPWGCLAETPAPLDPLTPQPQAVVYVVPIVDFANPPTRPDGLQIVVCQSNDGECTNPVPTMPMAVPNQPPAVVAIPLPYNFDGYLRLTATNYVTTEYYFGGPMIGSVDRQATVRGEAIPMLRQETMDGLFGDVMQTRDRRTGVLAIRTIKCRGERAAGVELEMINQVGFGWTLISNIPSGGDPPLPTDARGVAGFGNVPPGVIPVQGSMGELSFGRTAFRVRADQLTVGEVRKDVELYGR